MFVAYLPYWYALIATLGLFAVEKTEFKKPDEKSAQSLKAIPAFSPPGAPTSSAPPPETVYGKAKGSGWKGISVGPSLGLGIPHVANVGLEAQYKNTIGLALNYGFIPGISIQTTTVSMNSYDMRFRWFPFKRSFFVGLAYGVQNLVVNTHQTFSGIPVSATVDVSTTYLSPHIGWRWQWASGLFTGMDLGVQIATAVDTSVTTDPSNPLLTALPDYQTAVKTITDTGNSLGVTRLPFATLFEVGYFF